MRVTHTASYDATVDEVRALLVDPEFRQYAAEAREVFEVTVTVDATADGHVVVVDQVQPTEGVPSFAKKFAGERTRAILTETWHDDTAELTIDTPGRPAHISGSYRLADRGGLTEQVFEGEVKVKVPVIGGKLEQLVAQFFLEGREAEVAAAARWLEERG